MYRRRWYIGICFILITLFNIWANSLQTSIKSNEQSDRVLEVIEDVFRTPPLDTLEAQHIVRKAAHVAEFALLGLEMVLLLFLTGIMRRQNLVVILFVGLTFAVFDETIQVFSQRGSQVIDIWIDFAGLITGAGIELIVHTLLRRVRMHIAKQKQSVIDQKQLWPYNDARDF